MPEFKPGFTSLDYFVNNSFLGRAAPGDEKGFLRLSRFAVRFTLPPALEFLTENAGASTQVIQDFLESNVKSMDIPTVSVSHSQIGLRTQIGDRGPTDLSITFFESPGWSVHDVMRNWINETVDWRSDIENFNRKYLDEIKGGIEVFPLMGSGQRGTRKQVFSDVFPITINPISLNIEDDNTVGTVVIRFKYRFHTVETV